MAGPLHRLAKQYTAEKRRRGDWSATSVKMPRTALHTLTASFGSRPVSQLGGAAIERWGLSIGHLAPSTRRNYLNVVRAFSRWLIQHGHIRRDPCADVGRIKRPRTVVHVLSHDETEAVWRACETPRDRVMFALMYVLGLRCCEVSRLNVDDWDRHNRLLLITGKGGHERHLPVSESGAKALQAYIAAVPRSSGPMFPSPKRAGAITAQSISERMAYLMYQAGIKSGPRDGKSAHALRRTAATETLDASHNLRATQNLLGHADLSSMRAYIARASVSEISAAIAARFPEQRVAVISAAG